MSLSGSINKYISVIFMSIYKIRCDEIEFNLKDTPGQSRLGLS